MVPSLAEVTKDYPNWDLVTIFSFANSGKSVEQFRKDQKRIRQNRRKGAKEKQEKKKSEESQQLEQSASSMTNKLLIPFCFPQLK